MITLFLTSCASIKKLDSWKNPNYHGGPVYSLVVIGISDNDMKRYLYEDSLASAMDEAGVQTIKSYTLIDNPKKLNKDTLADVLKGKKIDAYIITKLVKKEDATRYNPGSVTVGHARVWGHYGRSIHTVHSPGYYSKHTVYFLDTSLFDAKNGKIIWAMSSKTSDLTSILKESKKLNSIIVKELRKEGLIN